MSLYKQSPFCIEKPENVNKVSKDVKDISEKVKALAESKNAMKEELLILQMDLKNMIEEESQLLEGTSNKFKVVE